MRRIIKICVCVFSALPLCLMLANCASQSQIAAQQLAQREALDEADDNACRSYGAEKGTEAYFNCRMMLNQQHAQTSLAQQEIQAQQSAAQLNASAALLSASGPHQ